MKKFFIGLFLGLILGWLTVPLLNAEDVDFKTYKQALKIMITIMQDIAKSSKITADNTTALRKKLVVE